MQDELVRCGRASGKVDTVGVLKTVDEAIEDERKKVRSINRCILILDIAMIILICGLVLSSLYIVSTVHDELSGSKWLLWLNFFSAVMTGINAGILAYASWIIRRTILN